MTEKRSAIVCSFIWPFTPGHSGGEIRDYHLFRKILSALNVEFISMTDARPAGREDALRQFAAAYYEPSVLRASFPHLIDRRALRRSWYSRLIGLLRLANLPVWGVKYHRDISLMDWQIRAYATPMLTKLLERQPPDFIFVAPQLNPVLLQLNRRIPDKTRAILLAYDVEAVRISRLAEIHNGLAKYAWTLESQRAARFERENIRHFDGIVTVSELDRTLMLDKYGLEPQRVLTVENSVDVGYFSASAPPEDGPPNIVFVGNLAYRPNHDAALRLLNDIMPRVRARIPNARSWIVGNAPGRELKSVALEGLDFITGSVEDVRPYLQKASAVCVPLRSGSGTKYKVLEALCSERPVVCTSLAAEGLRLEAGTHFLPAETDEEIADACIRILEHPEAHRNMAAAARQRAEEFYSWDRNLEKLDSWLDEIRRQPIYRTTRAALSD